MRKKTGGGGGGENVKVWCLANEGESGWGGRSRRTGKNNRGRGKPPNIGHIIARGIRRGFKERAHLGGKSGPRGINSRTRGAS